ncbi:Spliceosome-associated protein 49 [Recurvomyces mirabilis]|nr:Spliceosome-associated protein 49 [Recurvomyces mirabilis]
MSRFEQDKESTLYVGNLDERVTDALVWELLLQAGRVVNVHLPKDRVTGIHQGFGFVEFASEDDADYAAKIMNQIRLWGKPIRVNKASADKRTGPGGTAENAGIGGGAGVGADLFIGNLDPLADEKTLYDTFSRFGPLINAPKIARDDGGVSKGYGFVSYADFESSDGAVEKMHGGFLMNREAVVQYAYKRDGKGERHGDGAERALAEQAKRHGVKVVIPALPAGLVGGVPMGPQGGMGMGMGVNGGGMNGGGMGGYGGGMMQNGLTGAGPPQQQQQQQRTPQPPPAFNPYQQQQQQQQQPYQQTPGYGAPPSLPPQNIPMGYPPTMAPPIPQPYAHLPPTPTYSHNPLPPPPAGFPQAPQGFPPPPPHMNGSAPPLAPPGRNYNQSPLNSAPAGAGLPARPPPSTAGFGGAPPVLPPQGFPPGQGPPPGFRPPGQGQGQGQQQR